MQKTEQLCGVMTELLFSTRKREKNSETPKRIFLFASVTQRTQSRQTNDIPSLDGIILTEREAGREGTGGGQCLAERQRRRERERERLFTRPNEITTPSVLFIFLSTIFFFFISYYVILYRTRLQVYYILGVIERSSGRDISVYVYVCVYIETYTHQKKRKKKKTPTLPPLSHLLLPPVKGR